MDPNDGVFDDIDATPKVVAGMVLGSVAILAALKLAGFRFNIAVNVGR